MYAAFMDLVRGHPASEGNTGHRAPAGAGLSISGGSSAKHRATTRPYHCSQYSFSAAPVTNTGYASAAGTSCRDIQCNWGSYNNKRSSSVHNAPGSGGRSRSFANVGQPSILSTGTSVGAGSGSATPTLPPSPSSNGAAYLQTPSNSTLTGASLPSSGRRHDTPGCKTSVTSSPAPSINLATVSVSAEQAKRFQAALAADPVDVPRLRELSWQGCPVALRYEAWMFLTGCWTAQSATRQPNVMRRRVEYAAYIHSSYGIVDWDAVCAMVDSGVDTAVRRSTLKSMDQTAAAAVTPREVALADSLLGLPLGGSKRVGTSAGGSGALAPAAGVPQPRGLKQATVSLEDVLSIMQQRPSPTTTIVGDEAAASEERRTGEVSLRDGDTAPATPAGDSDVEGSGDAEPFSRSLQSGSGTMHVPHPIVTGDPSPTLPSSTTLTSNTPTTTATPPVGAAAAVAPAASGSGTAGAPPAGVPAPVAGHQLSVSTMLGSKELQTLKQIRKDIPRMSGGLCYLRHPRVQGSIERILFIWSLRHPACGYVQGMNDLVVPFMGVVLGYRFCPTRSITELHAYTEDMFDELWSVDAVPVMQWINEVEADVYWMTSYLLNTMQDNYTSSHAGITTMMRHLAAVVQAADAPLYHRLVDVMQLPFEQFTFRWMNCLLMRELTETQSLKLLDAYLSDEERRWSLTHVYVCAALLLRWGPQLMSFGDDYISAMKLLQSPPTEKLSPRDMQDVLSEAFVLQNLYEASLSRLTTTSLNR